MLTGLVVLAVLFAVEGAMPFYEDRRGRVRHGLRNLALALASGAVGAALAPLLLLATELAAGHRWGLSHWLGLDPLSTVVVTLVLFDLWMYAWHRANHEIPFLWRFHRVHHTDPEMDSTTALRFHPIEILLSSLANLPVLVLLGMSFEAFVLYKALMVAVILFHHSNVAVSDGIDQGLRRAIVPPSMHRVHHSVIEGERNTNYGTIFSFWDRLFGTFRLTDDAHAIRFGTGQFDGPDWRRPTRLLMLPFVHSPEPASVRAR